MPGQERINADRRTTDDVEPLDTDGAGGSAAPADLDHQVDSILDEIDSVLEENAEDFVKSFVQKGGQ